MPVGTLSITELLRPDNIRLGLPGSDKQEVVDHLIDALDGEPQIISLEMARADVWTREEQMSTGIGNGVALPHARTEAARNTVLAFATTAEPLEFGSIDGEPVRLIFLMLGPKASVDRHVRLLGRISRLMVMAGIRERLIEASSPDEVIDILGRAEEALDA
jgi:fructose PTS system EIIA component